LLNFELIFPPLPIIVSDLLKPVESALKNSSSGSSQPVGEFRIVLRKVNGSLGFTLQSTDETVLKHTVKVCKYCETKI
jgi:hypothetical protein